MRKKIGILRGLMPRHSQQEFAGSFKKIDSVFLTEKNLGQQNIYGFDPFKIITGKIVHQSWVGVNRDNLAKACKDLDYLETYELYHFFSGQAAEIAREKKIPLITEVWTSFLHPAYFLPPYSNNTKKVIVNTSLFIARSNRSRHALRSLGIPGKKIKVIYHGVNLKRFHPLLRKKAPGTKVFLFVGEMEKYKGVGLILEAWKIYFKKNSNDRLIMVGPGSMGSEVKKTKGVEYLGFKTHQKLPEIYRRANVFLSPSINRFVGPILWWEEFFSYTLMEAMASGLSIIASDSGGIPEEVEKDNIVIPQGNVQALLSAMNKVSLKNKNREIAEKKYNLHNQTGILEEAILKI